MDVYKQYYKGLYHTDLSCIMPGKSFPATCDIERFAIYRYYERLYTGEYAHGKKLKAIVDSAETDIPFVVMPVNLFKLTTDKIYSLVFGNETTIKTGDLTNDRLTNHLVEKTEFISKLGDSLIKRNIYGDVAIRISSNGINVLKPYQCFKIVDEHNYENELASVIFEFLYTHSANKKTLTHIRFEVHTAGQIYECVSRYSGTEYLGMIGERVEFEYRGRTIKPEGNIYNTGLDVSTVQWLSINKSVDGVYGQSPFIAFKDLVHAYEARLSAERWVLDGNTAPKLIVSANMLHENEKTHQYELNAVLDRYIPQYGDGENPPSYLTWPGDLDSSEHFKEDILSRAYELAEMNKPFISGEYKGNISTDTFQAIAKSPIDRASRDIDQTWYNERKCLYALCKLNDINVSIWDININHNIGRVDDDSKTAEVIKILNENKIFSKATLRERYFGYDKEQSQLEDTQINLELGGYSNGYDGRISKETKGISI